MTKKYTIPFTFSAIFAIRSPGRCGGNLYNDAALLAQLAEKETVLSPTHYYAVRKSAQRVLYDYVNSNNMMN